MADEKYADEELDALLAEYDTIRQKKKAPQATTQTAMAASTQTQAKPAHPAAPSVHDVPRKPDGTPYSLEELRQLQASRQAMRNRQRPMEGQASVNPASRPQPRPQPGMQPKNERARQSAAFDAAYHQQNMGHSLGQSPKQKKPVYRHRKPARPNGGLLLFALLILAVGGVSVGQIAKNRSAAEETAPTIPPIMSTTGEETLEDMGEATAEGEVSEEAMILWNTTEVDNRLVGAGDLILVNYQYPYAAADTVAVVDVYGNRNAFYQVSNTSIALTQSALDAMNKMTEGFYRVTSSNDMMIVSGYRNVQSQRDIYNDRVATQGEEMAALYVATPGYSEHHTGLAMDLSFYMDDGTSVNIEQYEHGPWLNENCTDYGFVLRYPQDKVDITKIGYEFWHYRYVGVPHAQIMVDKNQCLEEYIDYIKEYTPSTKLLWVQDGGQLTDVSVSALPSSGTLVYYVPADKESSTTEIRIPRGNLFENTRISGNNVDGFIVTVPIGK